MSFVEIPGFPDYKIDKTGNIYGKRYKTVLKPKLNRGYLSVGLMKNGKRYYKGLHRYLALTFLPNPSNLETVNHIDGNKLNNSLENLEWCTQRDNNIHALRTGLRVMYNLQLKTLKTIQKENNFQTVEEFLNFIENKYKQND